MSPHSDSVPRPVSKYTGKKDRVAGTQGRKNIAECLPPNAVSSIESVLIDMFRGSLFMAAMNENSPSWTRKNAMR